MTTTRRRMAIILTACAVTLLGVIAPASASTPSPSHGANEAHEIGYWKKAPLTGLLPVSLGSYSVTSRAQARAVLKATQCRTSTSNALGCLAGADLVASLNIASGLGDACMVANVAAANAFLIAHSYAGPGQRSPLSAPDRAQALVLAAPLYDSDDFPCVITSFPLDVVKSGAGSGTVMSTPAGISCGATCSASLPPGTAVTLSAISSVGSTFAGWSGAGCSGTGTCVVTMNAAASVTATFNQATYALTVTPSGTGSGTVSSTPAGISCGATCSSTFTHGTVVTLSAAPSIGSHFAGWSGGGCSGTGTCVVTITAATSVTATFDLNVAPVVSITSGPTGVIDQPTATFTFTDDGTPVARQCWVDAGQPVACSPSPGSYTTPSVSPGPHTFTVRVTNAYNQTDTDTRSWTYTPANHAPVLDASRTPVLNPVDQEAGVPVGTVGTLVSSLVDFAIPAGGLDNVTDQDGGAVLGIAVTAADTTHGTWYVTTGSGWVPMGAVSDSAAVLLGADGATRVYFKPTTGYVGTVSPALTFRAWDATAGTAGGTADTTTNGGSTAFSSATDTASIIVNPF